MHGEQWDRLINALVPLIVAIAAYVKAHVAGHTADTAKGIALRHEREYRKGDVPAQNGTRKEDL